MKKHYCGVFMTGYSSVMDRDLTEITERLSEMELVKFETSETRYEDVIGINLRFPVEKIVAIKKLVNKYGSDLGVLRWED